MAAVRSVAAAAVLLCALVAVLPLAVAQPAAAPLQPGDAAGVLPDSLPSGDAPAPAPAPEEPPPVIPYYEGRAEVIVCWRPMPPMVSECMDPNGTLAGLPSFVEGGLPPVTGYEPSVLLDTLSRYLEWPSRAGLKHVCVNTTEQLLAKVAKGECDLAPGVVSTPDVASAPGVVLTAGSYRTSLRALVRVGSAGGGSSWGSSWRFMDALSWEVWVALVVTSIGVGALIWAAEVATQNAKAAPSAIQATCWDALGRPTQTRDLVTFSAAGSLLALMFSLLTVFVMALYTANSAAILTTAHLNPEFRVNAFGDLAGKAVGTGDQYVSYLQRRNVSNVVGFPWRSGADLEAMLGALRSGAVDALLLEEPVLTRVDQGSCEFMLAGAKDLTRFTEFSFATALPASANNTADVLRRFDIGALEMLNRGEVEQARRTWVLRDAVACKSSEPDPTAQITFDQVAGLWVMLALAITMSVLLVLLHCWRHRWWPALRERPWVRKRLPKGLRSASTGRLQLGQLLESATRKLEKAVQPHPSRATSMASGGDFDAAVEQLAGSQPGSARRVLSRAQPGSAGSAGVGGLSRSGSGLLK